jgi:hypothetical protein
MSTIETGPAAPAETTAVDASQSRATEGAEPKPNSSQAYKRRPAYSRAFRGFLEQLGEDPGQFVTGTGRRLAAGHGFGRLRTGRRSLAGLKS